MKRQAPQRPPCPNAGDLRADAARLLARRPRTASELYRSLVERGHDRGEAARLCERLREQGTLDDSGLAVHYILARSARLGHGPRRLLRELEARGVAADVARAAWRAALDQHGLDPQRLLERAIAARLRGIRGRVDERAYRRVYNALLRAGFEAHEVRSGLERRREFSGIDVDDVMEGGEDE